MTTVPVIFSSDNNYVPYLYVAVGSLVGCINTDDAYKVYVLNTDISDENKKHFYDLQRDNLSVEFVDVSDLEKKYGKDIFSVSLHFTIATYYRFFLPELFPQYDKVIYLDCDMLIQKDVAELFKIDIGNNLLGATKDIEILRSYKKDENYYKNVLKLENVCNYLQAGCLIFNLKQMRRENTTQQLIDKLVEIKTPRFVDQCILNGVCQNRVHFIAQNWNYTWHILFVDKNYQQKISSEYATYYQQAKDDPYIIHFTGMNMKPEFYPDVKEAKLFLNYAFKSPFVNWHKNKIEQGKIFMHKQDKKLKKKLLKYKILSKITFGKMQKKYKVRYDELKG